MRVDKFILLRPIVISRIYNNRSFLCSVGPADRGIDVVRLDETPDEHGNCCIEFSDGAIAYIPSDSFGYEPYRGISPG